MDQVTQNPNVQTPVTAEEIQSWLVSQFSEQLGVEAEDISTTATLDSFGLDSAQGMLIATRTEEFLGLKLSPTLLWHYPTIESLSQRLAEEAAVMESDLLEQVDSTTLAEALAEIERLSQE